MCIRDSRGPLFADLAIWLSGDAYRAHFQRYPVIFLTLKGIKLESFDLTWQVIQKRLASLFEEHRALLDSGALSEAEARRYRQMLDGTAELSVCADALLDLSTYLHRVHGARVVILIDEYDTPIHAGYTRGYYDDVVAFFRDFLSGGFKDNAHLWKGVLTGILRVAKESLFSGLNNITVYGILRSEYAPYFGFTEPEVRALAEAAGVEPGQRVTLYCGVGISASLGLFALHLAGYDDLALYDGSWIEWGSAPQRPLERDP